MLDCDIVAAFEVGALCASAYMEIWPEKASRGTESAKQQQSVSMIIKLKPPSGEERSQVECCILSFLAYLNIIAICSPNKAACLMYSVFCSVSPSATASFAYSKLARI